MYTPYPEVDEVLTLLLAGVRQALGAQLVGLYLHGSLAGGDFDPARSDIDFVAATDGLLSQETIAALDGMHARLQASGLHWFNELEGSYLPLSFLRKVESGQVFPALHTGGDFSPDGHGSDWLIQLAVLREHGIVLCGPDPRELIPPASPQALRAAVRGVLREWWSEPLPSPARFDSRHYQSYAVLTMCRALYTLEYGSVPSKSAAARWAFSALDAHWSGLITHAMEWPRGIQLDEREETLAFLRFATQEAFK